MMVTMACETRCRRCGEPFPSDCHPVGRRRRQYRRRPAEGRVAHDVVGRYYDPANGQFLSVDPEIQQTLEAYLYTGDDPVNGIDPSGTVTVSAPGDAAYPQCGDRDVVGNDTWEICERLNEAGLVHPGNGWSKVWHFI